MVKQYFQKILSVFRVTPMQSKQLNKIVYHQDIASVEILLPKNIAEWLEKQASNDKLSPGLLIKSWILKVYQMKAKRVTE